MQNVNTTQEQELKEIRDELKNRVSWVVFVFIISLILGGIGWSLTGVSGADIKSDKAIQSASELSNRVSSIEAKQQAQFDEILRSLGRIEKQIQ